MNRIAKSLIMSAFAVVIAFVLTVPTLSKAAQNEDGCVVGEVAPTVTSEKSVKEYENVFKTTVTLTELPIVEEEDDTNTVLATRSSVQIGSYDNSIDYYSLMQQALEDAINAEDPTYALGMAEIYEISRNFKIDGEKLDYEKTHYFDISTGNDPQEIYYLIHPEERTYIEYTDEELIAVAKIVWNESRGCPDEHQKDVASVIVNRLNSNYGGASSIIEVITAPGQYVSSSRLSNMKYDEKSLANAKYVLDNGPTLPENVVYQANFKQGSGVYRQYYYPYLTYPYTYFCYG